jgi:hypothetical protein
VSARLDESRAESADQSAESVSRVAQFADGSARLRNLAEHYREGLLDAHIHVCSGANPEMAEARDFCTILHSYPGLHFDAHTDHGIAGFEHHRPRRADRDHWCQEAVLIGVAQFPEPEQGIADLPSVVWLNALDHCPVSRIDAIEALLPDLGFEDRPRVADRKLSLVAVTAPQQGELTNDVIQRRAKVVGYLADQDPETERRLGYWLQGNEIDDRIPGLFFYLMSEVIDVRVSEASRFGIQMLQMLPSSLDLRPRAVQRVPHA